MGAFSKTAATSVLSLQSVASATVLISSDIDVSTKIAVTICIHFGRRATTALTVGCKFRIEASPKTSGTGHWYPVAEFQSLVAASESEAVTGTVNASQNVVTMSSTTNLVAGDVLYIDNSTIANSEWHRIKSVSGGVSVTLEDNLVNAQTGSTVYDQGEMFLARIDVAAIKRMRLVVDNTGTGQAIAVEADMVTADSFA
jgi:hypothetical protein